MLHNTRAETVPPLVTDVMVIQWLCVEPHRWRMLLNTVWSSRQPGKFHLIWWVKSQTMCQRHPLVSFSYGWCSLVSLPSDVWRFHFKTCACSIKLLKTVLFKICFLFSAQLSSYLTLPVILIYTRHSAVFWYVYFLGHSICRRYQRWPPCDLHVWPRWFACLCHCLFMKRTQTKNVGSIFLVYTIHHMTGNKA